MGGVRIGGIAQIGCQDLGFAVIGTGGLGSIAIWLVQHNQANVELVQSRQFTGSLGDPTVSADFCDVLYSRIPNTTDTNYVTTVRTNDTGFADIASSSTGAATYNVSLQPSWNPNDQLVVFRGIEGFPVTPTDPSVERCDRDGGNRIDLLQGLITSFETTYDYPFYSDDGTKVLFSQTSQDGVGPATFGTDIYTMDADGTNIVNVASSATQKAIESVPVWIPGTTTVAYGIANANHLEVHTVEADGTGDTLLYTDPEVIESGGIEYAEKGLTPFAALPDGTGLLYAQYFPGDPAFFNYRVGIIDTSIGGWTAIAPQRVTANFQFNINTPVVRGGRIWWDDGMSGSGGDGIVSVAFDGSDYTIEDNTNVFTQKWFGS